MVFFMALLGLWRYIGGSIQIFLENQPKVYPLGYAVDGGEGVLVEELERLPDLPLHLLEDLLAGLVFHQEVRDVGVPPPPQLVPDPDAVPLRPRLHLGMGVQRPHPPKLVA
jgi:hypothetical protein